jgi:putative ABC transport system permease protein
VWRDAIHGARALRREPVFALTALVTLALGIATTVTVFTVADAELWKPLPFPSPDRLIAMHPIGPGSGRRFERLSVPDFADYQRSAKVAEYAADMAAGPGRRVLRREFAESVGVEEVSANFFRVLGIDPRMGRSFVPGQDERAQVAILSDRGWQRLFKADPAAVGTTVALDGAAYAIIGVFANQHFEVGPNPDFYVVFDPSAEALRDRTSRTLNVIGRMRDGAAMGQAEAELQGIAERIARDFPENHAGHRLELMTLREFYQHNNWRPLYLFLAAAAIVLLLACVNVANLLLARALRRQREFAIRGALGGGRAALVRQLLVEGGLLALPSASAGALLSVWAVRLFASQAPEDFLGRGGHFVFDARIAFFVVLVCTVTTILLSLAPLVFARRVELNLMLGQGGRTAGRTPIQVRARNGLLVAQLTMTLVLMVAAGLFVSSFVWLADVPVGFDAGGGVALRVSLTGPAYAGDAPRRAFAARLLDAARATPGVIDASIDSTSPLLSGPLLYIIAADRPRPEPGRETRTILRAVTADYFRALGIPQRDGRSFSAADVDGAPRVAIINEYLAAQLFPGARAIGQRIELLPTARGSWTDRPGVAEIVGVVANVRDVSVEEVQFADVYLPFAQAPSTAVELIVRSAIPPEGLAAPLRTAVAALDPSLPVARIETLDARVSESLKGARFNLLLIGSFAAVAILLACVGIYGAMACAVQERSREFGVRLALGQPPAAILRATVWQSARFGLIASGIGLGLSLVVARLIGNGLYLVRGEHSGLLHGVTTTDPLTLTSAAAALIVIATIAGVIPARQATRVDPLVVLRSE